MSTPSLTKRDPYHHGDLRHALIAAAVELAREGGPGAIVLREVARRVGVSPNAAYRHFAGLTELLEAVSAEGLSALARSMEDELAAGSAQADPRADPRPAALDRMIAVGRGYVHFALAEPGLFAAAFLHQKDGIGPSEGDGPSGLSAAGLLDRALDGLIVAGLLAGRDKDAAATTAWSAVHGLSTLLLGPLAGVPAGDREPMINAMLTFLGQGLIAPRPA